MLDQDRFPGARTDDRGRWQIPVADLEALGYRVEVESLAGTPAWDDRVAKLEAENRLLHERLTVAEALAAERLRLLDALTCEVTKRRR